MKTILRILIILLIGALISGALYLIVKNTSFETSVSGASHLGQMPAQPTGELAGLQTPTRGADHNVVSLSRGLSEVGVSLAKLTGITLLVLLVQKAFEQVKKWRVVRPVVG